MNEREGDICQYLETLKKFFLIIKKKTIQLFIQQFFKFIILETFLIITTDGVDTGV